MVFFSLNPRPIFYFFCHSLPHIFCWPSTHIFSLDAPTHILSQETPLPTAFFVNLTATFGPFRSPHEFILPHVLF